MSPWWLAAAPLGAWIAMRLWHRLQLSRAKHPSLRGHARMARRLARLVPFYAFDEDTFCVADDAGPELARQRRDGLLRLSARLTALAPRTLEAGRELVGAVSDLEFTANYRVPFPFRDVTRRLLPVGALLTATRGPQVQDLDGNWFYDLAGSYGTNVLGYDFYKDCVDRGVADTRELGPLLGQYHPLFVSTVQRLRELSGHDQVSFHMSGTEAVMQAVRLARYHTGRSHVVRFCGAYHGWWDGVQVGPGNPRPAREVYTLKELSDDTLQVLRTRKDVACVLVNPLQALHPNANAPSDGALVAGTRSAHFDRDAYRRWLHALRAVCDERGIALVFDEVFLGFRIALGGAQEYFGVRADLVTYGKTLGGGLPIGVLCGRGDLMRRFTPDRPADICFARGTFNSHPYVIGAMHAFLEHVTSPAGRAAYIDVDAVWDARVARWNDELQRRGLPVRVANMTSVCTVTFLEPGRYHWLLQFYLRAHGLHLSWIGTGRFIFGHDYTDADFAAVADRFVAAALQMRHDGWWTLPANASGKVIRRQVFVEMLRARLGRGGVRPATLRAARAAAEVTPAAAPTSRRSSDRAAAHAADGSATSSTA